MNDLTVITLILIALMGVYTAITNLALLNVEGRIIAAINAAKPNLEADRPSDLNGAGE